tara:strand:- start:757 stop:1116 length:360 start_codon:yes stop_codon:yes gene_type:complete
MDIFERIGRLIGGALVSDSFVSINPELTQGKFPVKRAHKAVEAIQGSPKSKTAVSSLKKIFSSYKTPRGIRTELQERINSLKRRAISKCKRLKITQKNEDFNKMIKPIQDIKDIIGPIS